MAEPIPGKGRVLTGLTDYWARAAKGTVASALVTCDPGEIDAAVPGFAGEPAWHGRAMLARRAEMLTLECIVRARLAGQAYDEYAARGTVHGEPAPPGMRPHRRLRAAALRALDQGGVRPRPQHQPSPRRPAWSARRSWTRPRGSAWSSSRCGAAAMAGAGLVLADSKFELGWVDGGLVVCDEVMTPDSSRVWPADEVVAGETPPAFDKQPFRDWLAAQPWDRTPPPPRVPDDVVAVTAARYASATSA